MAEILPELASYLDAGFKVLPVHSCVQSVCTCGRPNCSSPGKHPATGRGLYDATDDLEQITRWQEREPRWNWAVAVPGQYLILDVDPRNGGDNSFFSLKAAFGELPDTVEVLTGGGGHHFYFDCGPFTYKKGPLAGFPGIDVVTLGGYVLIPPSVHASGHAYEFEASSDLTEGAPIAPVPPWLHELLSEKPYEPDREPLPQPGVHAAGAEELASVREALAAISPEFYHTWVQVGQALQSTCWAEAFDLWNDWSRGSSKWPGDQELRRKWMTFDANRSISIKTLFWLAKANQKREEALPQFEVVRGQHLAATVEPVKFLISKTIEENGITVLSGEPNIGKSAMAIDMAACVSLGVNWNGHGVQQRPVLYLAQEGRGGIGMRLQAWQQKNRVDIGLGVFDVLKSYIDLTTHCAAFSAWLSETYAKPLVIIDTLAASLPGAQENESGPMGKFLIDCRRHLVEEAGATVLIIHHSPKANKWDLRGWSGLKGAVEGVLAAGRNDDDLLELRWIKQREGELLEPAGYEAEAVGIQRDGQQLFDQWGDRVTSVAVNWVDHARTDYDLIEVVRLVRENPGISKRKLREGINKRGATVDEAIERAVEAGSVVRRDDGYFAIG